MAGLTFDFAQTVALGPFNPHIITADWLREQKIATDEPDDYGSFPNFGDEDGSGFVLGGFEWSVSLSRLALVSRKPGGDCGGKAAAVMRLLNHTPVHAVGNNFVFTCSPKDWGDRLRPKGGNTPPGLEAGDSRLVYQYRGARVGDAAGPLIEVDLLYSPVAVVVQLNYDRRAGDSTAGRVAASEFLADQTNARELIKHLFDIEVTS